jgi:hypothetical protein
LNGRLNHQGKDVVGVGVARLMDEIDELKHTRSNKVLISIGIWEDLQISFWSKKRS